MNCGEESIAFKRPGTARTSITELWGSGQLNPTPKCFEDSEELTELYLSPERLPLSDDLDGLRNQDDWRSYILAFVFDKVLSGSDDLQDVTCLEICVDTRQNCLGNFGALLPNIVQLRMNNSFILSLRDLGTTFSHLQILWLAHCGLGDLDGISSLSSLKELYAAYNNVSDLSQVSMLECLELLDLEGNDVGDLVQVQYLGLCSQLTALTLEGNPICVRPHPDATETGQYTYRSAVRELIPQLRYLDDVPVQEEAPCSATPEDWALLREALRDRAPISALEHTAERPASACGHSSPCYDQPPGTGTVSRPGSAVSLTNTDSRPGSANSSSHSPDQETSQLTHGLGRVLFCGSPGKVLRMCRQKMKTASFQSEHSAQPNFVPEHTYDMDNSNSQDRTNVFAELRAWKEEYNKRLMAVEQERQPQVMSFHQSEEEDDYNEGGENNSPSTCETDRKEANLAGYSQWGNADNPDSSLRPSSAAATVPFSGRGSVEIRACRLRPSNPRSVMCKRPGTGTVMDSPIQRGEMSLHTEMPQNGSFFSIHRPRPPPSNPEIPKFAGQCTEGAGGLSISEHKPIICAARPERPAQPLTRPRTARAALQRLTNMQPLLPSRGSSQLMDKGWS